jgi:hypothetical protein
MGAGAYRLIPDFDWITSTEAAPLVAGFVKSRDILYKRMS